MRNVKSGIGLAALLGALGVVNLAQPPAPDYVPLAVTPTVDPTPIVERIEVEDGPTLPVTLLGEMRGEVAQLDQPDLVFCFADVILGDKGCLTKRALMRLDAKPLDYARMKDGVPREVTVTMVHPTDYALPPKLVKDCGAFAQLKRRNWGGMTSRDMAREGMFERFCGLRSLAMVAKGFGFSPFRKAGLTRRELASVPSDQWPLLGETVPKKPNFTADEETSRAWVAHQPEQVTHIRDVALADFDGDGEAERLLYVATRARGGTAGYSVFGILDMRNDGANFIPVEWR